MTELAIVDIPGERLADLSMAGTRYSEWSDDVLKLFDQHPRYRDESTAFRERLASDQTLDSARVILEYKRTLAPLIFSGLPVVTPSTMLITASGQYVPKEIREARDAEGLANLHFAGTSGATEFAPLPALVRLANPALVKQFERNYREYRKAIVDPLTHSLYSCDQLLVLVDIPTLLAGGSDVFNGCLHVIEEAIRYLAPGRSLLTAGFDRAMSVMTGGRKRLRGRPLRHAGRRCQSRARS